jgi:membrane associated rhomboid family serine protease
MLYFFYYFPMNMDVRPHRTVWGTWLLLLACLGGYLWAQWNPEFIWQHYESLIYVPEMPRPTALLLNAYLHASWIHLISNMVSLIVFAPALEDRLGTGRFLLLFHLCNVAANIIQGAVSLEWIPGAGSYGILGASGAIAGLLGLFLVRLHFARLRVGYWAFMPLQAYTRAGVVRLPVGIAVLLWFLTQLAIALTQMQGAAAQVAAASHLGGLFAGLGLGMMLRLRSQGVAESHLHRGRAWLDRAQWFAAQGEFIEYVRSRPEDPEGHLELARTYRLTDRHVPADRHYRAACVRLARAARMDRVLEVYREAERGHPDFVLDERLQHQVARLLERSLSLQDAERAWRTLALHFPTSGNAPLALFRAASLADDNESPWRAVEIRRELVDRYPDSNEAQLVEPRTLQHAA